MSELDIRAHMRYITVGTIQFLDSFGPKFTNTPQDTLKQILLGQPVLPECCYSVPPFQN
jgi:hypothetical protein